jgi:signal peptidase I
LLTAAFLVLLALGWWYLAPTPIGGSTGYVVTSGVSMEPRFHSGDLAIVRPAGTYRIGEIVAYRSTLLHVTVLHRIIRVEGDRYVFKGDNNNFIDPTRPTRADLLGALWIRVPHGGAVLRVVHAPVFAAVLCSALGLLVLLGLGEKRRRGRRDRAGSNRLGRLGALPVRPPAEHTVAPRIDWGALLIASTVAGAVFVVLGLVAFTRPARKSILVTTRYTQQVRFGYRGRAPAGPVYPGGVVRTGDPIFAQLVHQLSVHVEYRLSTTAVHGVTGTEQVLLRLTGPGGWSRSTVLAPRTRFTGDHTSTDVTVDLRRVEALLGQVATMTGIPSYTGYAIAVEPHVHISGVVAGQTVRTSFKPDLSFQLTATQLQPTAVSSAGTSGAGSSAGTSMAGPSAGAPSAGPGTGSDGTSQAQAALAQTQNGTVAAPATAPNTLSALGISPQIVTLRWIGLVGVLLSLACALGSYLRKRSEPFEETVRIQAQYGHMIVPIVGGEDLGWPPVDVPNIKALVKLAHSSQRLILHNRSGEVDTYLLNDDGTVYRYQVRASKVVWGEWSEPAAAVKAAA